MWMPPLSLLTRALGDASDTNIRDFSRDLARTPECSCHSHRPTLWSRDLAVASTLLSDAAEESAVFYRFRSSSASLPVHTRRLLSRAIAGALPEHVWCGRGRSQQSQGPGGQHDHETSARLDAGWMGTVGMIHLWSLRP